MQHHLFGFALLVSIALQATLPTLTQAAQLGGL